MFSYESRALRLHESHAAPEFQAVSSHSQAPALETRYLVSKRASRRSVENLRARLRSVWRRRECFSAKSLTSSPIEIDWHAPCARSSYARCAEKYSKIMPLCREETQAGSRALTRMDGSTFQPVLSVDRADSCPNWAWARWRTSSPSTTTIATSSITS